MRLDFSMGLRAQVEPRATLAAAMHRVADWIRGEPARVDATRRNPFGVGASLRRHEEARLGETFGDYHDRIGGIRPPFPPKRWTLQEKGAFRVWYPPIPGVVPPLPRDGETLGDFAKRAPKATAATFPRGAGDGWIWVASAHTWRPPPTHTQPECLSCSSLRHELDLARRDYAADMENLRREIADGLKIHLQNAERLRKERDRAMDNAADKAAELRAAHAARPMHIDSDQDLALCVVARFDMRTGPGEVLGAVADAYVKKLRPLSYVHGKRLAEELVTRIRCDAPAPVFAAPVFAALKKAAQDYIDIFDPSPSPQSEAADATPEPMPEPVNGG